MKIAYNNNLEALYGIDYCINRDRNIIRQDIISDEKGYFDELYRIYLEKIPNNVRSDVESIGDYRRKAEYALNGLQQLPDLSALSGLFMRAKGFQDRTISDIENDANFRKLNLEQKKDFFGIDEADEIDVILSMFLNGGFGVFNGSSNIILGAKFNPGTGKYTIADGVSGQIYHDFSYPYVQMLVKEQGIRANNDRIDEGYLEEVITRVLEIVFAAPQENEEEFFESALARQDKVSLNLVRIFLSEYLENRHNIANLRDYVDLLLDKGLVVKA